MKNYSKIVWRSSIFCLLIIAPGKMLSQKISAGTIHNLLIKADGSLWVWGGNSTGQLGTGDSEERSTPARIGGESSWSDVSAGELHSLAIKSDGTLWAWGKNEFGRLGDGTSTDRPEPTQIGVETSWKGVSAGKEHSLAIKNDGTMWAWGHNEFGQLGDGTTDDSLEPVQVGSDTDWLSVSAGQYHSMATKNDGTLWIWGDNTNDYLGDDATINCKATSLGNPGGDYSITFNDTYGDGWNGAAITVIIDGVGQEYTLSNGFSDVQIVSVPIESSFLSFEYKDGSYESEVSYSITGPDGFVIAQHGANPPVGLIQLYLCEGAILTYKAIPALVNNSSDWVYIKAGISNSFAIKSDGTLWAWGSNSYGQLGDGSKTDIKQPTQVGNESNWKEVGAGVDHTVAIKTNGQAWSWGGNAVGQLGIESLEDNLSPVEIPSEGTWVTATAGNGYSIGLADDGTLWAWGTNHDGVLGEGKSGLAPFPIRIGSDVDWAFANANVSYSLAEKSDGTLYGWGSNFSARLGDGTSINRSYPVLLSSETDRAKINSYRHALLLKDDGSIWSWGENHNGQVGDGTTSLKMTPGQVGEDTDWVDVFVGHNSSFAIKDDGTLWAWGRNTNGQLGDGTTIDKTVPVQIGTASDWNTLSSGFGHVLAIKDNGTLWSWGLNDRGQLGNSTLDYSTDPLQIGADSDWSTVSAGDYFSVAKKNNGTIWAWGSNDVGQLGDGSLLDKQVPVQITSDTDWEKISAERVTLAVKADGTLWAWGGNVFGQIGDGTYIDRTTPTKVGSDNDWSHVDAGSSHNVAIKSDGSLWAWGSNAAGRLGDGSAWSESPRLVKTSMDIVFNKGSFVTTTSGVETGTFSVVNESEEYQPTFSLVSGDGAYDNSSFTISGNTLVAATELDLASHRSYSIRVSAEDNFGNLFVKALTVSLLNNQPTNVVLSTAEFAENLPVGSELTTLSASDQDETDSHTYTLVTGEGDADNASFAVSGDKLLANAVFDYESKASYTIRLQAEDGAGAVFSAAFVITITDANDAPAALSLSASEFTENLPVGSELATLSTTDQDEIDSHTYTLVTGEGDADNASFAVSGDKLLANTVFDFETKAAYTVRIQTEDSGGEVFSQALAITITNANDLPSDILLSSSAITEQIIGGFEVGALSTTDQDEGDTHAYELVAGDGSTDNTLFTITNNKLLTNTAIADNKKESYSVRIQSKDASEGVFSKAFSISTANLKAEQVITFELPANLYPDESPVALSASSTSELAVSFVLVSGPATLDGNELTLTGSGEVVVMATQAGSEDFLPAANVTRTLIVKPFLSLAVTVNKSEDVVLGAGTATLLSSDGSIIKEATVGDGSLQMDGLKAGNYILQITPGEEESELVNTTYYPSAVSFEDAELISIVENTVLSMTMMAKEEVVQGLETPLGSLQLYPNPASDQLVVSLSLDELKALESMRLYSMDGQFLRNLSVEKGQASLYLDVKTLEPGVYFLRLTFQNGISTRKFLKE